ncbi:helix-turn-helix domain-containing protein [Streptomyces sp. NPDC020983]|uniref:AraC-like ligand-binding domain-containing protein n=1 Tax=Streptomyces sp. NPDC020983 TaxID=3365106 RepID=UPI0037A80BC0
MLRTVFDSRSVRAPERVAAWRDATAGALVGNEFSIDASAFHATLRTGAFGTAQVTALTYASMTSRRTPRLIRQADPEMYAVGLVVRGRQSIAQARTVSELGPQDLVVYTTSRPYRADVDARPDGAASLVVQVPRADVPLPPGLVDRLLATRLPARNGAGCLLAGFLTQLAADTAPCRPGDAHRIGGVLVDLVTAWLAHHTDSGDRTPAETRRQVLFLQIEDFVRRHLADPALSPATVAAAHHISLRTLHRLFQDHGHGATAAAHIRGRRLARARADLADPAQAARPVQAIAARWGFGHPPDFTRAFRAAYGLTPTDYRQAALRPRPGTQR